ncbi:hypothetical protein [Thermosulfurimonas marina]|nr:hypothetical protein [Thermosulfurimonas marina]
MNLSKDWPKILWILAFLALGGGLLREGYRLVFSNAASLCLSCMGLQ